MTLLWMLTACHGEAVVESLPDEPAVVEPTPTPSPPPPMTDEAPSRFLATWTSPSCGERTYPRNITFTPDFRFQAEDLVSPCPPDATCVWSGIVNRQGTWEVRGRAVVLLEDDDTTSREMASPLPADLASNQDGRLVELSASGENCAYEKISSGPAEKVIDPG